MPWYIATGSTMIDCLFEHKIWKINEVAHTDKEKIHCMKMRRTLEEGKEAQESH